MGSSSSRSSSAPMGSSSFFGGGGGALFRASKDRYQTSSEVSSLPFDSSRSWKLIDPFSPFRIAFFVRFDPLYNGCLVLQKLLISTATSSRSFAEGERSTIVAFIRFSRLSSRSSLKKDGRMR